MKNHSNFVLLLLLAGTLGACSSTPDTRQARAKSSGETLATSKPAPPPPYAATLKPGASSEEIVMYTMGLLDIDYRFGGNNPQSGLDCSGMVSYIYEQATGLKLPHNAARIAKLGREVPASELLPGDLVFFNTMNRSFSHVGIYIGDGRFVHAPATNGQIKVSLLSNSYFSRHFEMARRYLE